MKLKYLQVILTKCSLGEKTKPSVVIGHSKLNEAVKWKSKVLTRRFENAFVIRCKCIQGCLTYIRSTRLLQAALR